MQDNIMQIIRDNSLNISICKDGFIIIESWDDVNKIEALTQDKIDNIFKDWGFSDEYGICDDCYNHIELSPYDVIDYWINDGSIICGDCIRDNETLIDDYINHLINNPNNANTILKESHLENKGFKKCICDNDVCEFQSGLHQGMNDKPQNILKNAINKNPDKEYIFDINFVNMFETNYTIWNRIKTTEEN